MFCTVISEVNKLENCLLKIIKGTATINPQIALSKTEQLIALLILSNLFAPKFCPIKGVSDEEIAIIPTVANDSILNPIEPICE